MITKQITDLLNQQVNAELYSAYLYLSMSSYASSAGLKGTANWFFVQSQEEMTHAWRIYNYVTSRSQHVILESIDGPPVAFESPTALFEGALEHERKVTAMINNLSNEAVTAKDHATQVFLQWFVTEQIEEEENVSDVLAKMKLCGEGSGGLLLIDNELATRVFVPPPDLTGV
ncbi:MAG: ferritin [Lentisphaerales bacterium]|jgi:ferritin|nr:MAG: ferritin [Lentisphaerales bacterium]